MIHSGFLVDYLWCPCINFLCRKINSDHLGWRHHILIYNLPHTAVKADLKLLIYCFYILLVAKLKHRSRNNKLNPPRTFLLECSLHHLLAGVDI